MSGLIVITIQPPLGDHLLDREIALRDRIHEAERAED